MYLISILSISDIIPLHTGMRIQETWIPDTVPLLKSNKSKVVKSKSQDNLKDVILSCLKIGLNHFETARFYGSSEVQFVDALVELIEAGTIQRSDFIFQTKLMVGATTTRDEFIKQWGASWSNVHKLEYVDLMAFHCVSEAGQIDNILNEEEDGIMKFVESLKEEGKIKHIGFSTHGKCFREREREREKGVYFYVCHFVLGRRGVIYLVLI